MTGGRHAHGAVGPHHVGDVFAVELGPRGITSVSLRLGLVDAGRGGRFLDADGRREGLGHRLVSLEQAAATLAFLLSDQALAMTCTTITMDAGLTANKYL